MKSFAKYLAVVATLILLETVWTTLFDGVINPPELIYLLAIGIGFKIGPRRAAALGGLAALISESAAPHPDGFEVFVCMFLGAFSGWVADKIILDILVLRLMVVTAALGLGLLGQYLGGWATLEAVESVLKARGRAPMIEAGIGVNWAGALIALALWPLVSPMIEWIGMASPKEADAARISEGGLSKGADHVEAGN